MARQIRTIVLVVITLLVIAFLLVHLLPSSRSRELIRPFTIALGKQRPPLPYRIVSFHRGRADKNLIKLASQLGFNGVQFQIEGSNEQGIADFAERDAQEHLVDYCHALGMKVTVWVHELSDLPAPWMPENLGPVAVDNPALWDHLDQRYEWILKDELPTIDGLVLTVVETQVRATSTPILQKLVELIDNKCRQHGKFLIARTFVWRPDELEGVMGAVKAFPQDVVIMSKAVPQDWQMRGGNAAEIGAVEGRPQIEEFDACGEYFLKDAAANCMVDLLKRQFDYGLSQNIQGICVRVDRDDSSVLFGPNEVNLWTLGMLAAGATNDAQEIWDKWATYRYGERAAPGVIAALKPTSEVVAEMMSIGPFTFGDTRNLLPPLPRPFYRWDNTDSGGLRTSEEIFTQNWQNWRWDDKYLADYHKADDGDAAFTATVAQQKQQALAAADQCLADLDKVKAELPSAEYAILRTKLLTNQFQLSFRAPMAMAALHYRQISADRSPAETAAARQAYQKDIDQVRAAAMAVSTMPKPTSIDYLGKTWRIDVPDNPGRDNLYEWAYDAESLVGKSGN